MNCDISLILHVKCDDAVLRRCVSALNAPTLSKIQIIVADNTYHGYEQALRRKLNNFEERVKIFTAPPATPRWTQWKDALALAQGKYVMFIDHDQWLEHDAIDKLVECMNTSNADLAEMRTVKCIKGVAMKNNNPLPDNIPADQLITGEELRMLTRYIGNGSYISTSVSDKIYRREILNEVFTSDYSGEDSCSDILNIHYLRYARSMVFMSYAGLNYNWQADAGCYRYSSLADAKQAFVMKRLFGQDEACICEELINALITHASGLIIDNGWTPEAAEYFIEKELTDPLWQKAGLNLTAAQLVQSVDKRDRWLDFTKVLARLLR